MKRKERVIGVKESFFQFSDPQLTNLKFIVNEDFDEDLFSGFSIKSEIHNGIIEEEKEAVVSLKLIIGDKSESYPFHISIVMSANFSCTKKEFFDKLLKTNAPALLLSYARPVISLITTQAGYPSFNLPFMNFT